MALRGGPPGPSPPTASATASMPGNEPYPPPLPLPPSPAKDDRPYGRSGTSQAPLRGRSIPTRHDTPATLKVLSRHTWWHGDTTSTRLHKDASVWPPLVPPPPGAPPPHTPSAATGLTTTSWSCTTSFEPRLPVAHNRPQDVAGASEVGRSERLAGGGGVCIPPIQWHVPLRRWRWRCPALRCLHLLRIERRAPSFQRAPTELIDLLGILIQVLPYKWSHPPWHVSTRKGGGGRRTHTHTAGTVPLPRWSASVFYPDSTSAGSTTA